MAYGIQLLDHMPGVALYLPARHAQQGGGEPGKGLTPLLCCPGGQAVISPHDSCPASETVPAAQERHLESQVPIAFL